MVRYQYSVSTRDHLWRRGWCEPIADGFILLVSIYYKTFKQNTKKSKMYLIKLTINLTINTSPNHRYVKIVTL